MKLTPVLDRYQVSRELGRGGMAVVYLARQTDLDRWVALKELHPEGRDPSLVRRLERESRLAGSLSHPNIVTVHDFFEAGGTGYIAMEYVPRGSLRPYVGGLTFAQVAGVLEGVLAALGCAERHGIVHRDLKPENVMVTADGRVKLADFGIAKAAGATSMLTAAGTTLGTPHYMAPEQAMGQAVGPWTDLYSVGCMAYELVTGRLPFGDTDAPMAVLLRHINEVPAPACAVANVDPRLSDWISVLMAKDPAARPQCAMDAWETLEELVLAVEGPRWRRGCALPATDDQQIPGPYTPPPSTAVPADPVFETFHEGGSYEQSGLTGPGVPTPPAPAEPRAVVPAAGGSSSESPPGLREVPTPTAPAAEPPVAAPPAPTGPPAPTAPTAPAAAPHASSPSALTVPPRAAVQAPFVPARRRRRGALLAVGALVVAAGAGVALLPRGGDPPPPARVARAAVATTTPLDAGKVHVTLPPGWSVLSVPVAVPGLPRDRAAAPDGKESDGVVLVGMAPRDAHNPELVSPRLHAERPSEARLGELAAYRYDGLRWNGRSLTVYAAPTTAGVATVACLSPVSDCARIAASLQVPGAKGFPLGPDRAFAAAARRALKTPARSLAARTTKGQASAAAQIATDYRTARARIAHVKAGPADEPLRADLTRRLDKAAHAYRDLATAAAANARKRFASAARRAHAAEQLLRGTVRASVYRGAIDVARPRTIPALRRPPVIVVPAPTPLPRSDPPKPAPTPAPRTPIPPTPTPKRPKYTPCDFDCVPRDSGEG